VATGERAGATFKGLMECVLFWEMDPVFFGCERVNRLSCCANVVGGKINSCVWYPWVFVCLSRLKKENPLRLEGVCHLKITR